MEVNVPSILSELTREFEGYENALTTNNITRINAYFCDSPETIRYGKRDGECHYSYADLAEFRLSRGAVNGPRAIVKGRITTYGHDFGVTNIEYIPMGSKVAERQSQTWVRTSNGWKIVSAHVSVGK